MQKIQKEIKLTSATTCSGCAACVSFCPTGSISMKEDRERFLQPYIDTKTCIGCHKCEKTCPILNPIEIPTDYETQAYAAINKDEDVRMRSSSGGMFHALAKWTIEQGGVVFGARFNDQWEVVHDYTENIEDIEPFMRSKYVQSRIGDTFKQAKLFLNQGRWVLYSGTPCQIGGLYAYLHKDYERLITADIICHGVPSPTVWQKYINEIVEKDKIIDVNFRDKKNGWSGRQCITILGKQRCIMSSEPQLENTYFRGFLKNIYLRRSCYQCAFKTIHRCADITMADFWGVQNVCPQMNDDKGTSLVFCHTTKGLQMIRTLAPHFTMCVQPIEDAVAHNISMVESVEMPSRRKDFFRAFRFTKSFRYAARYIDKDKLSKRIVRKMKKLLHIK